MTDQTKPTGWTCPRCGKVYAPSVTACAPCNSPTAAKAFRSEGLRVAGLTNPPALLCTDCGKLRRRLYRAKCDICEGKDRG